MDRSSDNLAADGNAGVRSCCLTRRDPVLPVDGRRRSPHYLQVAREKKEKNKSNQMQPTLTPDLSSMLEAFPHPVMLLDDSFTIVTMNRLMEAITGYAAQRVCGLHGELVIRSNTGNTRGQLYVGVLKSDEAVSVKGDMLTYYRRKVPIQYTVSVLKEADGRKIGLMVVIEDISAGEKTTDTIAHDEQVAELIGYSSKMQKVFDMIPVLAQTDASVLITGETGTGKDKVAEILHKKSERARFPFVKINCGALPLELLESELFGHIRGAFTGATRTKPGKFKLAEKGTIFLTEIGDMPLPLQVKLLTVLDDRKFVPVGGEEEVSVDVRIIAATHRPLREQVEKGQFREDLFYRLNVLHVHLPPLREREGDVQYLLDHFLQKFAKALGKTQVGFAPDALPYLLNYTYPGNVRELSNIIEYAVNVSKKKKVNKEHLPQYLLEQQPGSTASGQELGPASETEPATESGQRKVTAKRPERETWDDIERQLIIDTLRQNSGNKTRTAETLGWGRMKLWRKMQKYEL
jgi:PAS domain S-box-containing protein